MSTYTPPQWNNKYVSWFDKRLPAITLMHKHLIVYPTPRNINYWWCFGVASAMALVIMLLTGIFLAMYYVADTRLAFDSVERIMRDVNYGWLLRYLHMNGASLFFILVYIHMFRGLYFGSFKAPREVLWWIGVTILFLMIMTAFMGYVLPWGNMSFWGATVITSLATAIPGIGQPLVEWIWGAHSVDQPTLNRFFAWHYLFPIIIAALAFVHMWALHEVKSGNPLGIDIKGPRDTIPFHPYHTVKDLYFLTIVLIFFSYFVFFSPNFFAEADNYVPANPLLTPPHIVPEWYFLPFYAILRAVDSKLGGVLLMLASILVLYIMPYLDRSPVRSGSFRPLFRWAFWIFVADCLFLGWLGAQLAEEPYITLIRIATVIYFAYFFVVLPLLNKYEKPDPLPDSISEPVTSRA
ncbi:cytochrome b N-terminal domain-containing protein [Phaeovibrio sulfidiphilus]|uniref:Cytochrome b n=2 Tax=cellular organisms TaxID=131567 RepID=A0A8J7CPF8_9PROT|nr:cytochrome b N-terminal domain-containing protein [Phaeovibrio sulfidiphilus]MBE1236977.1 cytochrome b N-terminal domain-containing protein [Phaeovibrio sulfidiphilus]